MADEERKRRQSFFSDLEQFYRKKWNSQLKTPNFNGRPVDLYRLYKKVTTLGGWNKVSTLNKWSEVSEALNMPTKCYGIEHAVKMIYMRYLARYQQHQMFGEDHDDANDSGAGSSHRSSRGKHYLSLIVSNRAEGPNHLSSRGVHQITDAARLSGGFSNDLIERGPYEKLIRSLQSGLPNETDFALNSCLVMGSSSHNISLSTLRPNQTLALLDLLLAHVGFFEEGTSSYRVLYENGWKKQWDNMKFIEFWHESIEDDDIKELLTPSECRTKLTNVTERRIFNLSQQFGAHNLVSQKILLVGNILRNFSFEAEFKSTLATNRTMLKYLLVCINSKFANLQSLGWDILSNLSSELALDPFDSVLTQILFRTLNKSLNSSDKFRIIRALETIGGLCANEKNEPLLCEFMEPYVIRRLIALLAVKDIMMCVHLLECLYSVSEMGQIPCQRIAEQPKAIDTFISLVTVEAVSFGPSGLMGMKVVEFGMPQPHTAILPQPFRSNSVSASVTTTNVTATSSTVSNTTSASVAKTTAATSGITVSSNFNSSSNVPPPFMAKPVRATVAVAASAPTTTTTPATFQNSFMLNSNVAASPSPTKSLTKSPANQSETKRASKKAKKEPKPATPVNNVSSSASPAPAAAPFRGPAVQVQQDQQAELIASNWLKQNCTACGESSISRAELYAMYVQRGGNAKGNMSVSINTFATLIRQNFPSCQLRQTSNVNCKTPIIEIDGLKFSSPLPVGSTPTPCPANPTTPIVAASKSPLTTIPNSSIVASQHPLTHQILSQRPPQFSPGPPSSVCPTSPAHSGTNSPAVRSLVSSCGGRVRSDSFGTADSYSLPATPDSVISATTNSSSLFGPKSPPSPLLATAKTKKSKSKKKNPLVSNCSVPSTTTTTATTTPPIVGVCTGVNCQLEVCHPAQEAQAVVETGDDHKAMIIRIENSTNDKKITATNNNHKPVNGQIDSDTSPDNSRQSSADLSQPQPNSIVVSLLNKKGTEKKPSLNLNGLIKPSTINLHSPPNNVVVVAQQHQSSCQNHVTTASQVVKNNLDNNSRTQSPSPDMETMKLNIQQQQENIQQLLMTPPQNESSSTTMDEDSILDSVNAVLYETMAERRLNEQLGIETTTPTTIKKKPKRKSKKKNADVDVDGVELKIEDIHFEDIVETPKKMPKKKPSKRKNAVLAAIDDPTAVPTDDGAPPAKKKKKTKKQRELENHLANNVDTTANQSLVHQQSFRQPLPPVLNSTVPQTNQLQQPLQYVATIQQQGGTTAQIVVRVPPPAAGKLKYTCEWEGCEKTFDTCTMITYHVGKAHVLSDLTVTSCRWAHCDKTPRLTWSLIAHIQDVHCNERILRAAAIRRYEISLTGQSNIPETKSPPPHPGYPPDAALAAIRRHALVALPKDVTEENEGPVTKSIRLASCLILRNLARYSSDGRRVLRKYERILSYLAMSRLESSIALSQCLAELHAQHSPHSSRTVDDDEFETNDR